MSQIISLLEVMEVFSPHLQKPAPLKNSSSLNNPQPPIYPNIPTCRYYHTRIGFLSSVWVIDSSDPSAAIASFTVDFPGYHGQSDLISIDFLQERFTVNLHLTDYTFSLGTTYVVHAGLFGEELGVTSFVVKPKEVAIDIWPGLKKNIIIFSRRLGHPIGIVPVAILSSAEFNAPEEVDKSSLTFGKTGNEGNSYYCLSRNKDLNHDRLKDLLCFFAVNNTGFQPGDTEGILKGQTNSGISIEGQDSVYIIAVR